MKHIILYTLLATFIGACGINGNQRFTADGETNHRIELDLLFIAQVKELCDEIHPEDSKAAAQCTIDNMALLNINLDGSLEAVCPTDDVPPALQEFCLNPGLDLDGL